jgi:cobaltochelatase CobN
MHLLAAQPGGINDGSEAVDLGQTPGDIVFLSAADTELTALADAQSKLTQDRTQMPTLRLANLMHLAHNMSVDLYVEQVIKGAKLVVVRLLGGRGYWSYGADEILVVCQENKIPVAFLPGDDQADSELDELTSVNADVQNRLWQYLVHGGSINASEFLKYTASLVGADADWQEPSPLVKAGLYWPDGAATTLADLRSYWKPKQPIAAVVFYRALVQAGNTKVIDALVLGLSDAGLNPLPVFAQSLKNPEATAIMEQLFKNAPPDIILNGTGFSFSAPGSNSV